MKRVDHAFDSIPLIKNAAPPRLGNVGTHMKGQPMDFSVNMLGKVVKVRTVEWEFEVEILDSGEDATDLYDQEKYGKHLGAKEVEVLKRGRHPVAFPIYAGKIINCTALISAPQKSPINVGETLALMDDHWH